MKSSRGTSFDRGVLFFQNFFSLPLLQRAAKRPRNCPRPGEKPSNTKVKSGALSAGFEGDMRLRTRPR